MKTPAHGEPRAALLARIPLRPAANLRSPNPGNPPLLPAIDLHPDLPPCAGCGRCCHLVVELRPGDSVPEEIVAEREGTHCLDQHGDGACVALDPVTRLCTIYDIRPQTCRDFTRGEALCRRILGLPAAPPAPGTKPA